MVGKKSNFDREVRRKAREHEEMSKTGEDLFNKHVYISEVRNSEFQGLKGGDIEGLEEYDKEMGKKYSSDWREKRNIMGEIKDIKKYSREGNFSRAMNSVEMILINQKKLNNEKDKQIYANMLNSRLGNTFKDVEKYLENNKERKMTKKEVLDINRLLKLIKKVKNPDEEDSKWTYIDKNMQHEIWRKTYREKNFSDLYSRELEKYAPPQERKELIKYLEKIKPQLQENDKNSGLEKAITIISLGAAIVGIAIGYPALTGNVIAEHVRGSMTAGATLFLLGLLGVFLTNRK